MPYEDFVISKKGVLKEYLGHDTEIVLPERIKSIGPGVFSRDHGYGDVVRLTVPEGVTEIRSSAFEDSSLEEISLPSTLETIGDMAFYGCRNLKSVIIPDGVREISDRAFKWSGLEEIHLPEKLSVIGREAFRSCKKLKKIDLPESDALRIGTGAFCGCVGLIDENGMLVIRNRLYAYQTETSEAVVKVDIPDNVTVVEEGVFDAYEYVDITMPLHCPYWPVNVDPYHNSAYSIIRNSGSSLSFRNSDGEITAKVVLETMGEEEETETYCILAIQSRVTGGFEFDLYDESFSELTRADNKTAMALARLRYPYELSEEMEEQYVSWFRENGSEAGKILLGRNDAESMRFLEQKKVFDADTVTELIQYAQEQQMSEWVLDLLEYQNREFGKRDAYLPLKLPDHSGEDSEEE
ncbi:MAG: leucine-rich repeat domain-containing protein [Solobacterium sp.]|nr:leucine-rich repeat domain-containing protein [Solobacterium sp.]